MLTLRLLPPSAAAETRGRLDVAGAVTVTAALMLAVYAIVNGNENGWLSAETLGLLAAAAVLVAGFFVIENRVREPLMPLAVLKLRNIWASNLVGILWAASMFAWFFLSALYMQLVLGYSPLQVGLAFLPGQRDHGPLLGRALGEARDALRDQAAARHRARVRRGGLAPALVRARSTAPSSSTSCPA